MQKFLVQILPAIWYNVGTIASSPSLVSEFAVVIVCFMDHTCERICVRQCVTTELLFQCGK